MSQAKQGRLKMPHMLGKNEWSVPPRFDPPQSLQRAIAPGGVSDLKMTLAMPTERRGRGEHTRVFHVALLVDHRPRPLERAELRSYRGDLR